MKNKNKLFSVPLLLAFLSFAVAIACMVLSLFNIANLVFVVISISLTVISIILFLVHLNMNKEEVKVSDTDKTDIIQALDSISKNEEMGLLNIYSEDEQLLDIARRINKIYLGQNVLIPNKFYKGNHFFEEISKLIRRKELEDFVYMRIQGINKKIYDEVVEGFPRRYACLKKEYIDVVLPAPYVRDDVISRLSGLVEKYPSMLVVMAFSRDYSLPEIIKYVDDQYKFDNPRLQIYEAPQESFRSISRKYASMDLAKDRILNDYLKEVYDYLPFTHIGIKFNDEYYRLCTLGTLKQMDQVDESEFIYFKQHELFRFKGDVISIVLASTESVEFDANTEENTTNFCRMVRLLMVHELCKDEYDYLGHRYERLEALSKSLSYEVDDDYNITYASKQLENHSKTPLLGQKCYKALHKRNEPCKNCPLKKGEVTNMYALGSRAFNARYATNEDNETIYLLNQPKPYMPNKSDLSDKLLSLINSNSRGYLLVFKLDNLLTTASRMKTDVEVLVDQMIKTLAVYGLDDNLYRKDVDEFVYILEDASVPDAMAIAQDLSRVFLEKFHTDSGDVGFAPKQILFSYPLEVNTLFALESLSRKLFSTVTDKGRLHRLDEPPMPVDNHRYYIEILERSYKEWSIPIKYNLIKDLQGNRHLSYVALDYVDDLGNPIPEEELTLYTKNDGTYLTLMDKFIRALDFSVEKYEYILPISKEGLDLKEANALIPYFNSIKVSPSRLIFEIKEKDAFVRQDIVKQMAAMGFKFGMVVKDNLMYKSKLGFYSYIKIDGKKLSKDKRYQFKINTMLNKNASLMVDEEYQSLLSNVRYVCK